MTKLTEEEKETLEKELITCRGNLQAINKDLNELTELKKDCWKQFIHWRDKFNFIDRKLAFDSKLTVIKRGRSGRISVQLKNILKDKKKLKELIDLLQGEMKEEDR